jgi:hypothetical protein
MIVDGLPSAEQLRELAIQEMEAIREELKPLEKRFAHIYSRSRLQDPQLVDRISALRKALARESKTYEWLKLVGNTYSSLVAQALRAQVQISGIEAMTDCELVSAWAIPGHVDIFDAIIEVPGLDDGDTGIILLQTSISSCLAQMLAKHSA